MAERIVVPEVTPAQATGPSTARRRLRRAAVIGLALFSALLDWLICTKIIGLGLIVDQGFGPTEVMPIQVAAAPVLSGLSAWALLAILERVTPARARTIWPIVAAVVMILSLYSPITMALATSTAIALVSMHLVVGVILIIGLPRAGRGGRS